MADRGPSPLQAENWRGQGVRLVGKGLTDGTRASIGSRPQDRFAERQDGSRRAATRKYVAGEGRWHLCLPLWQGRRSGRLPAENGRSLRVRPALGRTPVRSTPLFHCKHLPNRTNWNLGGESTTARRRRGGAGSGARAGRPAQLRLDLLLDAQQTNPLTLIIELIRCNELIEWTS